MTVLVPAIVALIPERRLPKVGTNVEAPAIVVVNRCRPLSDGTKVDVPAIVPVIACFPLNVAVKVLAPAIVAVIRP